MSSKKRKSVTSPNSQASISKFFQSFERQPKKRKCSDEDNEEDGVMIISENENPEKRIELDEKPERTQRETQRDSVSRLKSFKRQEKTGDEKLKAIVKPKDEKPKIASGHKTKNGENINSVSPPTDGTTVVPQDRGVLFSEISKMKRKVSYTALENQIIAIKLKHMEILLMVEVGYRYRFFGEDAEIAAKELNIQVFMDKNFLTASIPVHRLTVHMSKLIEKGYKVGVVKQTETAALKAAGDNKSAPFTRKLSNVYTKGTFIDREEGEDGASDVTSGRYIVSISDVVQTGNDIPYIAVYCVNPTSGDIAVINVDRDENFITKLQTLFCALKPSEVILPKQTTDQRMDNFIRQYCKGNEARLEQVDSVDKILITEEDLHNKLGPNFQCNGILKCISLMNSYLKEFELQNILASLRNYRLYSLQRNCMYMDGATLRNLEVLENSSDKTLRGSLLWIVDHTHTVFGKRMMRRWLVQPLIKVKQINRRLDAVGELVEHNESVAIKEIIKNLKGCLDIEKSLTGIFYRKISPDKFIRTLEALNKLNNVLVQQAEELDSNFKSPLLQSIFTKVPKLLGTDIEEELGRLDKVSASKGNLENLFVNEDDYPSIGKCKNKIADLENKLNEHKDNAVRKILGGGPVEFRTVSGLEYLIEVKNKELSKVPKDWVKVNSTKQVARFRPLFVEENFKKLCQVREKLKMAADAAWEKYLNDFSDMYDYCRKAVQKFAELDCLLSLATVAMQSDHCRPEILEDYESIEIVNGRHPVLSALLPENEQYVGNDTLLKDKNKAMIVSGPNMGGKSSYIRQVAVNCILAQLGSYIPASSAKLCPLDGIYTRMGSSDDIARGRSTFMVELEEASMIIREATTKSLVILDELGRGTSTYDGMAIAFATLKYFIEEAKSFTLFVTHYPMLSEFENLYPNNISNFHMAFMSADTDGSEELEKTTSAVKSIVFLYKLVHGAAKKSYGLNVAQLAGIPESVLSQAAIKSTAMEEEVSKRIDNVQLLKSVFLADLPVSVLKTHFSGKAK